jgi:hypothetical protein
MGCDIHLHVERRAESGWEHVASPDNWSMLDLEIKSEIAATWWRGRWFRDRNYELFAWLADVRNYHQQIPLAPERGLPEGVSTETLSQYTLEVVDTEKEHEEDGEGRCLRSDAERWVAQESSVWLVPGKVISGPDWHSASWFTVAELMGGLETLVTKHGGAVSEETYLKWKASGEAFPDSWCQTSSRPNISETAYLAGERPDEQRLSRHGGRFTIECEWSVSGRESFARFHKFLGEVSKLGAPDDVRIVFWFDS